MTDKESLGYKYAYGDEKNGIFVDLEKATECYRQAGVPFRYRAPREDPHFADYYLRGSAQELEPVKTLVNELAEQYGTPWNELGLYVPMEILMKTLVGSEYYVGNLLTMNTDSPECIVLHAEANKMEPLLYALRQAFPNLNIEMKKQDGKLALNKACK